jgi:hypothetical protein
MRTSRIIFGVIFLAIGGLLYFLPMQELIAKTAAVMGGNFDKRTSSEGITVPVQWAFASVILALVLLILGFKIPSPNNNSNTKKDSYHT